MRERQMRQALLSATMALVSLSSAIAINGKLKQALGWSIRPESPAHDRLIRKDGGTAGFSSVIVLCPAKDLAIFVVTNQGRAEASNIGTEIADRVRAGINYLAAGLHQRRIRPVLTPIDPIYFAA